MHGTTVLWRTEWDTPYGKSVWNVQVILAFAMKSAKMACTISADSIVLWIRKQTLFFFLMEGSPLLCICCKPQNSSKKDTAMFSQCSEVASSSRLKKLRCVLYFCHEMHRIFVQLATNFTFSFTIFLRAYVKPKTCSLVEFSSYWTYGFVCVSVSVCICVYIYIKIIIVLYTWNRIRYLMIFERTSEIYI